MSAGIEKLFEEAESLADRRRLLPALQVLEEVRRVARTPGPQAFATYNLGAIYWHLLGNGEAARREFLAAAAKLDAHGYGQDMWLRTIHANALENAMLCALSFDEFEDLAARLAAINPELPIVTGLLPEVRAARERGEPWSNRLLAIAGNYYDRNDPRRDVGRYGEARSTYHLLLTHRRVLRLSREDWRLVVFEFCALSMRMAVDCSVARGGDHDPDSPEEFLPILTEAMPLVDEYLAVSTGDEEMKKTRQGMDEIVFNSRNRWTSLCQLGLLSSARNDLRQVSPLPSARTDYRVCQRCGTVSARRDISGPTLFTDLGEDPALCLKCGGWVIWQSSPVPAPRPGPGCFLVLLLGILLALSWLVPGLLR